MPVLPLELYTVSTKSVLDSNPWTEQPDLICDSLAIGLAPTLDQASFVWHYGHLTRAGQSNSEYIGPLALRNQFVRVQMPGAFVDWVGIVVGEESRRDAVESYQDAPPAGPVLTRFFSGDQMFSAVGLEWILTQTRILDTVYYGGERRQRVVAFNAGHGEGRDVAYADRGNKDTRGRLFATDKEHSTLWSGYDILFYMFENQLPKDKDGLTSPTNWFLDPSAANYLDSIYPTVQVEGRTFYDVVQQVVSPRRGVYWRITSQSIFDATVLTLEVGSMATAAIALPGGGTILQNTHQVALPTVDTDPKVDSVSVSYDETRQADQVVVRGALRRAVFTVGTAAGNLVPAWQAADETEYLVGASGAGDYPINPDERKDRNDMVRASQKLERVYQAWQIPPTWNGLVTDGGASGGSAEACARFNQGSPSVVGVEKLNVSGLRLLPTMPIKAGWDYANAGAPVANDPFLNESESQTPFAFIDLDSTGKWRFAHEIGAHEEQATKKTSYHLRLLSGAPGIQLQPSGGMPHALAKGHYDVASPAPSNYIVETSYDQLRATVCGEWDAHCEGYYPTINTATGTIRKVLIDIGDRARFDWMAQNTVYDIQDGVLKKVATAGAIRDDRGLCENIARAAWEWYAIPRGLVSIEFRSIYTADLSLGYMITSLGAGNTLTSVNAVVSRIEYKPEAGAARLAAGFTEIDFTDL